MLKGTKIACAVGYSTIIVRKSTINAGMRTGVAIILLKGTKIAGVGSLYDNSSA